LLAFQEKDAAFFFGRETFVDGLVRVAHQQPLLAVIGSSGSGKSSVVLAGLIPKLREAGCWLIESFRPNKQPFYELAAALISQIEPELGKTDKTIKAKELAESIRQHGFTADVSAILKDNPGKRLLLVVDQFEELYTGCADTEQQQFVDALLDAVESASRTVTLVLTLRADFYSYVVNYPPFGEALNKYPAQNLSLVNAEEMLSAIELPAKKMGVKLEEGLTQQILNEVKQQPGNLPLLEFALTQLWDKQSRGQLTHQAYSEIGGVAKALSNHAEAVYGKLSEEEQKQAQRIFLQLVRPGERMEHTRRVATRAEIGNWELVTFLAGADARLVVTGRDEATGEETVEVVHEALIREWETLRGWIENDCTFRTWQEQLRASMHKWEATNKDEGALLRGVLLAEAEDWRHKRLDELSQEEQVFIQLSWALQDREKEERKIQRLRNTLNLYMASFLGFQVICLIVFINRNAIELALITADKKHLDESNLAKRYLPGVDLSSGNLSKSNLSQANLTEANLSGTNLQKAEFVKTYMPRANLSQANLLQAKLSQADLTEANLSGTNLQKAEFVKTYMPRANLSQANLSQANFSQANLEAANLSRANLSGTDFQGAYGLQPDQVKRAKNWDKARYDEEFRKKLGLK
jgi:uncharacterized protein YjbI with pentapeptide repeats